MLIEARETRELDDSKTLPDFTVSGFCGFGFIEWAFWARGIRFKPMVERSQGPSEHFWVT